MVEYGGVYADLDFVSYKPLDQLLEQHDCIITQEPYIHAVFRLNVPVSIPQSD